MPASYLNRDQFWAAQPGHSLDDIEAMTPEEYGGALDAAARIQRGQPERAMDRLVKATGGGLYGYAAEHVGDLTHRMSEGGGRFGREFVAPKVRRMSEALNHPYGFEREVAEQQVENRAHAESKGRPLPPQADIDELAFQYAEAHQQVPAYTRPTHTARYAAVELGKAGTGNPIETDFGHVRSALKDLSYDMAQPDAHWKDQMSQQGAVRWMKRHENIMREDAHIQGRSWEY